MTATKPTGAAQSAQPAAERRRRYDVLIIGAGPSSIGAAIRLRQAGITDFAVLEKATEIGGTWRDNIYPGCACDVPSALYSYCFAPTPEWTRAFAKQPAIAAYLRATAERLGVTEHVRHGVEVQRAQWNARERQWELRTTEGEFTARIVIAGTGPWHEPLIPPIPGLDHHVPRIERRLLRRFPAAQRALRTPSTRGWRRSALAFAIRGSYASSSAEVDAVIFGTGFHIIDMPVAAKVFDSEGRSLHDHWKGSPQAYLSMAVSGFPNAFLLLGPSLGTGYTSAFMILEAQLDYAIAGVLRILREGWAEVGVRPDVQAAFNTEV